MVSSRKWISVLALGLTMALTSACGSSGQAKVAFKNTLVDLGTMRTNALTENTGTVTPTEFQMKLIAVYLAEDIDPVTQNNVGGTEMIYLNPACNEDISNCDLSGATYAPTYFDFSGSSATVNAAINAQARSVAAGSYKYVRIEFCKYNPENAAGVKFKTADMSEAKEFKHTNCGVTSAEAVPPIPVEEGKTVTISLAYDLDKSVFESTSAPAYDYCGPVAAGSHCFSIPQFTPSAIIE